MTERDNIELNAVTALEGAIPSALEQERMVANDNGEPLAEEVTEVTDPDEELQVGPGDEQSE